MVRRHVADHLRYNEWELLNEAGLKGLFLLAPCIPRFGPFLDFPLLPRLLQIKYLIFLTDVLIHEKSERPVAKGRRPGMAKCRARASTFLSETEIIKPWSAPSDNSASSATRLQNR